MNPEVNLINNILKNKDIITPMDAGVEKSFVLFSEEFEFLKEYFGKYREVASVTVFTEKFPGFDVYDTDGNINHYINELHQWRAKHILQEIIANGAESLSARGPYDTVKQMTTAMSTLAKDTRQHRDIDLIANSEDRLENLRERLELRASGKKIIGVPSGIEAIDDAFGGWQKGDFIVLAGWTGSAKSWLALKFAQHAWSEGYRVLYFSLEMSSLQIGYRFDTLVSGASGEGISNSDLTHATNITFDRYKTWLGDVTRDKQPFTVITNEDLEEVDQDTVAAKIELWKPDLVILDYHGLFDDASGAIGETEKAKNLSKAFKRLAIKTATPIIDITGVTMPQGAHGTRPPELSELAWSKQLAYDSDLTLAMCKIDDVLEVVAQKTRRGKTFRFFLDWDIDTGIVKERSKKFVFGTEDDDEQA